MEASNSSSLDTVILPYCRMCLADVLSHLAQGHIRSVVTVYELTYLHDMPAIRHAAALGGATLTVLEGYAPQQQSQHNSTALSTEESQADELDEPSNKRIHKLVHSTK